MIRTAVLKADLPTRIGTFAPGVRVNVIAIDGRRVKICLDVASHASWRCHIVTVPRSLVELHNNAGRNQLPEIDCAIKEAS